jgi:hypothetical protein
MKPAGAQKRDRGVDSLEKSLYLHATRDEEGRGK